MKADDVTTTSLLSIPAEIICDAMKRLILKENNNKSN